MGPLRSATSKPRLAGADLAGPRLVALEHVAEHAGAAGLGQELGAEADQAAGRHEVVEAHPTGAGFTMFCIRALRTASSCVTAPRCSSGTSIVTRSTGSWTLAVDLLGEHDLGLPTVELEALAAHRLDEDRQLQLATSLDLPRIGSIGRVDRGC